MRGELCYAISMLDSFRWQMARGWHMEMGQRIESGKGLWSKVEGTRSPLSKDQNTKLKNWYCQPNEQQIMNTVADMVPEFLALYSSLCRITGLEENRAWCARGLDEVL